MQFYWTLKDAAAFNRTGGLQGGYSVKLPLNSIKQITLTPYNTHTPYKQTKHIYKIMITNLNQFPKGKEDNQS